MTTNPMSWEGAINPRVAENQCAQDCLLPMGEAQGWGLGGGGAPRRDGGWVGALAALPRS